MIEIEKIFLPLNVIYEEKTSSVKNNSMKEMNTSPSQMIKRERKNYGIHEATLHKLLQLVEYRKSFMKKNGYCQNMVEACKFVEIDPKTAKKWIEIFGMELRTCWQDTGYDGESFVEGLIALYPYLETDWKNKGKWEF